MNVIPVIGRRLDDSAGFSDDTTDEELVRGSSGLSAAVVAGRQLYWQCFGDFVASDSNRAMRSYSTTMTACFHSAVDGCC